jgi:predicted metal-dependent phosphoesterase TrpH
MPKTYTWEAVYVVAALEPDNSRLSERIDEARKVLDARIAELPRDASAEDERRAIAEAHHALRVLWTERGSD